MRKILYVSGSRADYGLMRRTLFQIHRHAGMELEVLVTAMHLMPEFGKTINEIKRDKFRIHRLGAAYKDDDKNSAVNFMAGFISKFAGYLKRIKPEMILLLGDRPEMLAAAMTGVYLMIPVAHIHGGDVSSTVDEIARHAITKLAHLHFAATQKAARRIIKMGEERWRVYVTGAPGLDEIRQERFFSSREIAEKYRLDFSRPVLLVLQHPVTAEVKEAARQMTETMEALKGLEYQSIVIYPNADPGARSMIQAIERYRKYPFIRIYKNIPRRDYLGLMKVSSLLVGNSSSGIIEAPAFGLAVVNIGQRQQDRERAQNIIDSGYHRSQIKRAIKKAIADKKFRASLHKCRSPYGDGRAGEKIASILSKIKINRSFLQKKITY